MPSLRTRLPAGSGTTEATKVWLMSLAGLPITRHIRVPQTISFGFSNKMHGSFFEFSLPQHNFLRITFPTMRLFALQRSKTTSLIAIEMNKN